MTGGRKDPRERGWCSSVLRGPALLWCIIGGGICKLSCRNRKALKARPNHLDWIRQATETDFIPGKGEGRDEIVHLLHGPGVRVRSWVWARRGHVQPNTNNHQNRAQSGTWTEWNREKKRRRRRVSWWCKIAHFSWGNSLFEHTPLRSTEDEAFGLGLGNVLVVTCKGDHPAVILVCRWDYQARTSRKWNLNTYMIFGDTLDFPW